MVSVSANHLGVFAVENGKVIAFARFPKNPEQILSKLSMLKKGEEIEELREALAELKRLDIKEIITEFPLSLMEFKVEVKEENEARRLLRERSIAKELGLSDREYNEIVSSVAIAKTREEIKKMAGLDLIAIQVVGALDNMRDITNRLAERLREWYGIYYPELQIKDNETYAKCIARHGKREKIPGFERSMGVDLKQDDILAIQSFARQTASAYKLRREVEKYLTDLMFRVAPNVTSLIGPYLAAKLIAQAGSLEKLAKLPASTIQLLGAEKALFKYMRGRKRKKSGPPKYGIIFAHPAIQRAPDYLKGKVARVIASKLAIAARTDFYLKELKPEYERDLQEKIEEILGSR